MLFNKAVQVVLAAAVLWHGPSEAAAAAAVRLCGRQLSEIMSRVCHAYNSPSWDVPTVVEQPGAMARRKRQLGIADECCVIGCTWEQLSEYCSISANSESSLEEHLISDRSAELGGSRSGNKPAVVAAKGEAHAHEPRREVGRARTRGYGRARARARCWCRRKRRSGRRRTPLMGNMELVKFARAAPEVGTVSPLITWGRTLNTDLPTVERDRYAYVVS